MVTSCATTFICGFNFAGVKIVEDCIYGAHRMILRDERTNVWRKKKIIVLIVIFILYLCYRMDIVFVFALQIYKISYTGGIVHNGDVRKTMAARGLVNGRVPT